MKKNVGKTFTAMILLLVLRVQYLTIDRWTVRVENQSSGQMGKV